MRSICENTEGNVMPGGGRLRTLLRRSKVRSLLSLHSACSWKFRPLHRGRRKKEKAWELESVPTCRWGAVAGRIPSGSGRRSVFQ